MNQTEHVGVEVAHRNSYSIINCENCNFIHAVTQEDNNHQELYKSHFYSEEKPNYIEDNKNDSEWWDFTYGLRIKQADKLRSSETENWLDIGTGPGYFLDAGLKLSKQVLGIEPGRLAAEHASSKGHKVINDYFTSENAANLGIFHGIHCSEVLEHIPNPSEFLSAIKKAMDEKSILCLVVPNDFSIIQDIYTKLNPEVGEWWIDPPFHLNYFNRQSLNNLLQRNGLEVIYETCMFPIDVFLLMGEHYVGNDEIGKRVHDRRRQMEFAFDKTMNVEVLSRMYEEMAKIGIGRELVVFAKKVTIS